MTMGAVQALRGRAHMFYCNTEDQSLESIHPPRPEPDPLPQDVLTIDHALACSGLAARRMTLPGDDWQAQRESQLALTATLSLADELGWLATRTGRWPLRSMLHKLGAQAREGGHFQPVQTVQGITAPALHHTVVALFDELWNQGVLVEWSYLPDGDNGTLTPEFADEPAAAYVSGGYLEEFVLRCAQDLDLPAHHVAANVGVDLIRPSENRRGDEINELDVVLVWRNRLLLIEFKSGLQVFEPGGAQIMINRLAALDRVAGPMGALWLVSQRELGRETHPDLYDRARLHQLTVASGRAELLTLTNRLAGWAGLPRPHGATRWAELDLSLKWAKRKPAHR